MTKLVQVDAPGDLPAGYEFDATVDGKTVRRLLRNRIFRFVHLEPLLHYFHLLSHIFTYLSLSLNLPRRSSK